MAQIRPAGQALELLAIRTHQHHICRSCRAQHTRQLHTSPRTLADNKPYLQRVKESVFGPGKKSEAEQKWEEEAAERTKEMARWYDSEGSMEQRASRDNTEVYTIAPIVDPTVNKEYEPAGTWDGLERMGGKQWIKAKQDAGEVYEG